MDKVIRVGFAMDGPEGIKIVSAATSVPKE